MADVDKIGCADEMRDPAFTANSDGDGDYEVYLLAEFHVTGLVSVPIHPSPLGPARRDSAKPPIRRLEAADGGLRSAITRMFHRPRTGRG